MRAFATRAARHLLPTFAALALGCAGHAASAPPAARPCSASPSGTTSGHRHHGKRGTHGGHRHGEAHGPLVHRFEDADAWAARFEAPSRNRWQRPNEVVAAMRLRPGMTVVDLGTGTGYFLPYLSPALGEDGRLLAVDIEPSMVRYVRDRAARGGLRNVVPQLALTDDPLLEPDSVDRILIVDTWHHIPERKRYAVKLARALRAGGEVWVIDFRLDADHGPPKAHRLPPEVVAAELAQAGLQTRIDERLLPKQYILVARRPAPERSPASGTRDSPFAF